jgi:hypothetical protein
VHLEVVCIGGTPATTVEALHRFFRALSAAKSPEPVGQTALPAPRPMTARVARLNEQLGIERQLDLALGPATSVEAVTSGAGTSASGSRSGSGGSPLPDRGSNDGSPLGPGEPP